MKEFTLDTPLTIEINDVGAVRFVLPVDTTPPEKLTRLTMVLTPVAKPRDAPSVLAAEDQRDSDATPIAESPFLPREAIQPLLERDIRTVGDFLGVVADARFSVQLASLLRVKREELGRWSDSIRLASVGGFTTKQMDSLQEFGVVSLLKMARMTDELRRMLEEKFPGLFPANLLVGVVEKARARVAGTMPVK